MWLVGREAERARRVRNDENKSILKNTVLPDILFFDLGPTEKPAQGPPLKRPKDLATVARRLANLKLSPAQLEDVMKAVEGPGTTPEQQAPFAVEILRTEKDMECGLQQGIGLPFEETDVTEANEAEGTEAEQLFPENDEKWQNDRAWNIRAAIVICAFVSVVVGIILAVNFATAVDSIDGVADVYLNTVNIIEKQVRDLLLSHRSRNLSSN